jgi:hypothetical protein
MQGFLYRCAADPKLDGEFIEVETIARRVIVSQNPAAQHSVDIIADVAVVDRKNARRGGLLNHDLVNSRKNFRFQRF